MVAILAKRTAFYALVAAIIIMAVFPFYYAVLTSFKSGTALFQVDYWPTEISFENYAGVVSSSGFLRNLANSLLVATIVVAVSLLLAVTAAYALFGPALIDIMTASPEVQRDARLYLWLVTLAPVLGVFAFAYDGIFIGATWARDMRNLMVLSLVIFLAAWFALRPFGNTGLWGALLVLYVARGGLQALRYPALVKATFRSCGAAPSQSTSLRGTQGDA